MSKAKNVKTTTKNSGFFTPSQQWLGLTLLALLAVIAIFYFGIGAINNGGGYSG